MASDIPATGIPRPIRTAGAVTFGALFAVESFARAINATVVSLQAYDLLKSSQKVSELSTLVSLCVLAASLTLPLFMARVPRRWIYTAGGLIMMMACVLLASHTIIGQASGSFMRNLAASMMNVALSLYILDHFKKADLTRVEPLRLSLSTVSWTIGPSLGVWLYTTHGPWAPQAAAIASSGVLLVFFWYLRLGDHAIIRRGGEGQPSPLDNVSRFISQPRLRLAWMIAFGRSCYWATFFIYGPLLLLEGGLGKQAGGWMISLSQLVLATSFLFGRLSRRIGVRKVIAGAFAVAAAAAIAAGFAGTAHPLIAAGLLLAGALACSALDAVGGIPYLRAVRHRERPQMTSVYRTFIDFSELIPAAMFSLVLLYFPIGSVFVLLGLWLCVVCFIAARHLPRSL